MISLLIDLNQKNLTHHVSFFMILKFIFKKLLLHFSELGIHDIGEYLKAEREKREHIQIFLQQSAQTAVTKRGPPRKTEQRRLLASKEFNDKLLSKEIRQGKSIF